MWRGRISFELARAPILYCILLWVFAGAQSANMAAHDSATQNTARQPRPSGSDISRKSERKGVFKHFKLFFFLNLLGYGITSFTFYYGYHYGDFIPTPAAPTGHGNNNTVIDMSIRLAFAIRCSLPLALSLFFAVAMVGNKRSVSDAVDPLSGNEHIVQLDKNFLANTLEQCVIGFILMLVVASYAETPQELRLLPIFATIFVIARAVFRIGYSVHHILRALGMSGNICGNYVLIGVSMYSLATKGLNVWLFQTTAKFRTEL